MGNDDSHTANKCHSSMPENISRSSFRKVMDEEEMLEQWALSDGGQKSSDTFELSFKKIRAEDKYNSDTIE